ncbi:reverse transcriptase [Senna tora]|uniref:Reverse transcriptase n=1 Tax=Senna tora TaxID=362788 RepID=A0A834T506_9FABA|nr:reverse transcriptase [Senna tora]
MLSADLITLQRNGLILILPPSVIYSKNYPVGIFKKIETKAVLKRHVLALLKGDIMNRTMLRGVLPVRSRSTYLNAWMKLVENSLNFHIKYHSVSSLTCLMDSLTILSCNARGAQIINSLGFAKSFVVDSMGYASGIWLLWDDDMIKMTIRGHSLQEVHATVTINGTPTLFISFVYASPIRDRRRILWNNLNPIGIVVLIIDHFTSCFTSTPVTNPPYNCLPQRSSPLNFGNFIPTHDEIRNALWSLKPFKAAEVDGFQPGFYQKFWSIVERFVSSDIQQDFCLKEINPALNATMFCLIPKCQWPIKIGNFWPISLCNIHYKIISKILIMHLKPQIPSFISFNQGAFVLNRKLVNYVLIAQELVVKFKRSKGRVGWMLIKIDLEKAYDKINWVFLIDTLSLFEFPQDWVGIIHSCIYSVTHSILINGNASSHIVPSCGILQRDPLSPYLFILRMEVLTLLINKETHFAYQQRDEEKNLEFP